MMFRVGVELYQYIYILPLSYSSIWLGEALYVLERSYVVNYCDALQPGRNCADMLRLFATYTLISILRPSSTDH